MEFGGEKEEFKEEEVEESSEKDHDSPQADPFTQLMFGHRIPPRARNQDVPQENEEDKKSEKEVNYFTLMQQIDDIMVSLDNLKPVLKELSPILDFFKKKNK